MIPNKYTRTTSTLLDRCDDHDEIVIDGHELLIKKLHNKGRDHYIVIFKNTELKQKWDNIVVVTEVDMFQGIWWMGIKPSKQYDCFEGMDKLIEKELKDVLTKERKASIMDLMNEQP